MLPRTILNIFVDYPTYSTRTTGYSARLEASIVRCYVNVSAADLVALNLKAPTVFAMLRRSLENDLGSMLHDFDNNNRQSKKKTTTTTQPKMIVVGKEGQLRYEFVVRESSGDRGEIVLLNNPPNYGRAGFLNREVEIYVLGPSSVSAGKTHSLVANGDATSRGASSSTSSSSSSSTSSGFATLSPAVVANAMTSDDGDGDVDMDFEDD